MERHPHSIHPKQEGSMQYIEQTITGIDGTTARFIGYVPDNSPEVVPDRTRPTVLIVPGGGYEMTSDREGEPIALQFLAADCNAFVLRYSCAPSVYPTALLEVAEAMRLMRLRSTPPRCSKWPRRCASFWTMPKRGTSTRRASPCSASPRAAIWPPTSPHPPPTACCVRTATTPRCSRRPRSCSPTRSSPPANTATTAVSARCSATATATTTRCAR